MLQTKITRAAAAGVQPPRAAHTAIDDLLDDFDNFGTVVRIACLCLLQDDLARKPVRAACVAVFGSLAWGPEGTSLTCLPLKFDRA